MAFMKSLERFLYFFHVFLSFSLTICNGTLISTQIKADGKGESVFLDKSEEKYYYFSIPTTNFSFPANLLLKITSETLPNELELYQGIDGVLFPNETTKNFKRQIIMFENNGTASFELTIYAGNKLNFGLTAKYNSKLTITASLFEIEKTPIWKTILFVFAGIVSTGILIWLCYSLMKHVNNCCEKMTDCIEDSWYSFSSKIRRPCKKRVQNHIVPNEGAPRVILVASMPDVGRFRFENRLIPVIVDKLDKLAEAIPDEKNVVGIPEDFICSVCMIRKKTMIFDPCNHVCCCSVCSREIIILQKKCPLCREIINDVKLAF